MHTAVDYIPQGAPFQGWAIIAMSVLISFGILVGLFLLCAWVAEHKPGERHVGWHTGAGNPNAPYIPVFRNYSWDDFDKDFARFTARLDNLERNAKELRHLTLSVLIDQKPSAGVQLPLF